MIDPSTTAIPNQQYQAVFVHSFWRSSSTYFLSRLEDDSTILFDEPFHELIQTNRLKDSESLAQSGGEYVQLHHPKNFKYFQSYDFLENLDQLTNPDNIMADYLGIAKKDAFQPFIKMLIEFSQQKNKLPIFGFTRSLGRSLLLKEIFPDAYSIFLYRDPFDQFISAFQQQKENNNFYFLVNYPIILWENKHLDIIQDFWAFYPELQPSFSFDGTMESLVKLIQYFSHQDMAFYLQAFLLVFLIAGDTAFCSADLIIDTDSLKNESSRHIITKRINQQLNLTCNFNRFYAPKYTQNSDFYNLYRKSLEESINFLVHYPLNQQWLAFLLKETDAMMRNSHDEALQFLVNSTRRDSLEYKKENETLKQQLSEAKAGEIELNYLRQNLNQVNQRLAILSNSLDDERFENKRLNQQLTQLQTAKEESISHYQSQLAELQRKVNELEPQLQTAKERITAIETSKFWKLRKIWFRIRQTLGIPGD